MDARPARYLLLLLAAFSVGIAACNTEHVRTAPFRARPSSTEAGDLRGPFSGRVLDANTDKPVAGALVYTVWTFSRGYGFDEPAGVREHVTSTDADGDYEVPKLDDFPDGSGIHLVDVSMVIYKRGYVAYRSDRRFSDFGLRTSFTQQRNEVRLSPWRPGMSHVRHLRYIGSGKVLAALTGWEAELAAAELSGDGPQMPRGDFLVAGAGARRVTANVLLTADDVADATGYKGELETGTLGDQANTDTYSSVLLRAVGRPEDFDIALRLWELSPTEASSRYDELRNLLPGVVETNEVADRSLRASEPRFYGIAFVDERRGVVGLMTCGRSLCASHDVAAAIAARVVKRIERLWPMPGGKPPPKSGPPSRKPAPSAPAPAEPAPAKPAPAEPAPAEPAPAEPDAAPTSPSQGTSTP